MLHLRCSALTAIVLVAQLMVAASAQSSNMSLTLRHHRNQNNNVITLYCRNEEGRNVTGAIFFLNESVLNHIDYPSFSNKDGVVTFLINRRLEGQCSCGIGDLRSNNVSFITYPTTDLGNVNFTRRTNYAVTGGTVVLECLISPGALIHQYYVTWRNGNRTLFKQSSPLARNSNDPTSTDPRYSLDPMDLSLIIDNVQMSDSSDSYYCDLHVQDPNSLNTDTYSATQRLNISLTVLSPPVIITDPRSSTISQKTNAIFICEAQGNPLPTITWQHNGETVTDTQPDYLVTPNKNESSMTATSQLRIFFADVDKSGQVTCIASATPPRASGITLDSDDRTTSLTVLGKFKKFDVLISMSGDVIFFFDLPTIYNQSVHLFIKYIDGYNSSRSYNRTTTIGFVNTQSIQHVEYSSQVYYNSFQVRVGLVSEGVHGPLSPSPVVYDKDVATICDGTIEERYVFLFGTLPAGCLLLINVILFCVIFVLICINRGHVSLDEADKFVNSIVEKFKDIGSSTSPIDAKPVVDPKKRTGRGSVPTNTHRQESSTESDVTAETTSPVITPSSPAVETVAQMGSQNDTDGVSVPTNRRQTQRQGSSTESDGTEETSFTANLTSNTSAPKKSHKRHPGYEKLKKSIDECFTGQKCSHLKRKLKEHCKKCT